MSSECVDRSCGFHLVHKQELRNLSIIWSISGSPAGATTKKVVALELEILIE